MARVAVALALALLIQGAFTAPSCGCAGPIGLPFPGAYDAGYAGLAYPDALAGAYPAPLAGAYAPLPAAALAAAPLAAAALPGAYAPGLYPDAGLYAPAPVAASSTPLAPVGAPQVVGTSAGPSTAYTTGPVCKTATFEVPIKSATSAIAGPVSVKSDIVDGYCSTSCAATRARCGGTTKNVSFKTPTIINKGSRTYSSVSAIGNPVTTRNTQAGTPLVSTQVSPGPSYPATPVYGPGAYAPAAFAPGAYAPAAFASAAYAPAAFAPGAYAPDAYALGAAPFVAGLNSADLGAAYLPAPAAPVAYPGVYPAPAPSTCACTCA